MTGEDAVLKVVIADDEEECRRELATCPERFKVCEVENVNDLVGKVQEIFDAGDKADLVLLDVWCPPNQAPEDQEQREQRARKSLRDLTAQLERTRKAVKEAWIPRGFDILKQLRERWPDPDELPIAMYSKRGHFLATSAELELVENLRTHWILKHDANEYFEYVQDRIDRLVNIHRGNRALRKKLGRMRIVSLGAIFVSISLLVLLFGRHMSGATRTIPGVLVSCALTVLFTYGLNKLISWWLDR